MSWTRVSAVLPAVLAACARVNAAEDAPDGGPSQPAIAAVEPEPGAAEAGARFTVRFTTAMDEGQLLAASGRSETVVLAADADVERAAAAIEHSQLSAHERALFVPAQPSVAPDRKSITLTPDEPLRAGKLWLLVSPRLKDDAGRKLAATGSRYPFEVAGPALAPSLVSPEAGSEAPSNLAVVRARAASGRVALHGPGGAEIAAADAHGEVALALQAPLVAGARYVLALDGVEAAQESFTAGPCARDAAPALAGGLARILVRDTSVVAEGALDWPAQVEVRVGSGDAEPCSAGCAIATASVACRMKACGPPAFDCQLSTRVEGLQPARAYALRVVARDDLGHESRGPLQKFSTVAPLPRLIISEVMATPLSPQAEAEYIEILNLGPGAAVLDTLSLVEGDGVVRPLVAVPPPVPVVLAPGARALAVGGAFLVSRYPGVPPETPVLRASTHRLLGRGLNDSAPQPFRLMLGSVELAHFPAGAPRCTAGTSLQRDEAAPPEADGTWACGAAGGTPGAPP